MENNSLKIYAQFICGSKSFNLWSENSSDIDQCIITNNFRMARTQYCHSGHDTKIYTGEKFVNALLDYSKLPTMIQVFTPYSYNNFTPLIQFLVQEREQWIIANLQNIYSTFMLKITSINQNSSKKMLLHAARFCHTLLRYEKYQDWNKAQWMDEDLRNELLNIKTGNWSKAKSLQYIYNLKTEVNKIKEFYNKPIDHEYNKWFYSTILNLTK